MVIGIVALLLTIGMAVMNAVQRKADNTRMRMDLAAIATALEAYKTDFGDYPRPAVGMQAEKGLLAWALIAPGPATVDGNDGPGFRTTSGVGKVWGPYLPADKFGMEKVSDSEWYIQDKFGGRIQYIVTNPRHIAGRDLIGTLPGVLITSSQGIAYPDAELKKLLGDKNVSNKIDGTEKLNFAGPYILISYGSDKAAGGGDDIANFETE